ncbi:MAG: UDP-N-acetylglucosamine diphosphorylase [Parachlamydiaceae bacterium]
MFKLDIPTFFDLTKYAHRSFIENCDALWDPLSKLEPYLKECLKGNFPSSNYPGAILVNPDLIKIGQGTVVEPGAYIEGPCVIGDHCTIRHGAYIRGNVLAGNHCVIGHGTELKNTILLDHVHIAHLSYAGDSIFGNGCNLGAGAKCANLRFDGKPIVIHYQEQKYLTNRRKFGVIAGDHVQLGCNSVTNPGTLLGKGVYLFPCTNFGGVAPPHAMIQLEAKAIPIFKE